MDNSKLIRNFYTNYQKLLNEVFDNIEIIENIEEKNKYITIFFNRLMIMFFLEKEGYLDNNTNFLEDNLKKYMNNNENFYIFFKDICFNYLGNKENQNFKYKVPYIDVSFFKNNNLDLEYNYILINNSVFESIFITFNKYRWVLKDEEVDSVISPKILGSIFEKYINKKQMGAYYTSSDTTKYISKNVIGSRILYEINNKFYLNLDEKEYIEKNIDIMEIILNLMDNEKILKYILKIILGKKCLSIIDPTCGSGAFIFSALEIIEEILEKAFFILKKTENTNENKYLKTVLKKLENHKNFKYFLVKKIISNNLFGIDIEEEAVEILKLRIYLKLLSLIKNIDELEVFPDLNKNFFYGNSLVGSVYLKDEFFNNNENNQIFNWNQNYKHILKNGGFDCIIGNPPYIEYTKLNPKYEVNDISTIKCGNLYAFIIERSMQILKENGICGMIVPISIISTPRMTSLRNYLLNNSKYIFFSNFGDRPGCLFQGVHQKLTIFINQKINQNKAEIFTSEYIHWYSTHERNNIFNNLKYYKNNFLKDIDKCIFKIGNQLQENILKKIFIKKKSLLLNFDKEGTKSIYLNMRLTFWIKCFYKEKKSKEYKKFFLIDEEKSKVLMAILNSSLFFLFWEITSDNWHITSKELNLFKFNYSTLDKSIKINLKTLAEELENDLEKNKRFIGSKQVDYEYVHKFSKQIIDKIDDELGIYYKFTKEELEFIKNYNLKYRAGEK